MSLKNLLKSLSLRKQKSIWLASLVLSFSFAISAALGLVRERVIYPRFLSCCPEELDVYKAAFKLPDIVFKLLVTGALSASFMPVFLSYSEKDKKHAHLLASSVINVLSIALFVCLFIIYIFAWPLSRILAPGFDQYQLLLMVRLTRILLIAQVFFLISNFFTSIIQSNQIFLIPSLSPILYNLSIILATLFLAPSLGIYGVCIGAVIGSFLHFLIQLPLVLRLGFRYSLSFDTKIEGFSKIVKLMIPRSISTGLTEIESFFSLRWASVLPAGSYALYALALQLVFLPSRIFSTTISQASLPILSKRVAQNKIKKFKSLVISTLLQALFLSFPITVIFLVYRLPITRLIFGSRQFPWSATIKIAQIMVYLSPSIFLQSIIQILNRAFYAAHNTKTPLNISVKALVISLLITFILVKYFNLGVLGLAIGVSISNLIQSFGLIVEFSRQVYKLNFKKLSQKIFKIIVSSFIMSLVAWFFVKAFDMTLFDTSRTLNLLLLVSFGSISSFLAYLFTSSLLKIDQMSTFLKLLTPVRLFKHY